MFHSLSILATSGDLAGFARSNGLRFDAKAPVPMAGGGLLELLTAGYVSDRVSGPGWETGNLQAPPQLVVSNRMEGGQRVTTLSTSEDSIFERAPQGYLALTMSRQLPNMILDAKRNNSRFGSSLLHPPLRDQRLSLEGDFDNYFDLFVPSGYERDALYVFTPDLMALMIDETSDFDVEIRGNQLMVYSSTAFDLCNPATWAWIERVMTVVGMKTFSQTDGYSDERVGSRSSNVVAPEGRLLRRTILTRDTRPIIWAFVIGVAVMLVIGAVTTVGFALAFFAL